MFSIAEGQAKVINCNSANKSCLLQVVHTKAITALTQFCDYFYRQLKERLLSVALIVCLALAIFYFPTNIVQNLVWNQNMFMKFPNPSLTLSLCFSEVSVHSFEDKQSNLRGFGLLHPLVKILFVRNLEKRIQGYLERKLENIINKNAEQLLVTNYLHISRNQ